MEQPPGSLDDLQPQDQSTSSIPTVIDLTRNGEEYVLNATSLDALRMVKSPSWHPNSGTTNPGLPFSETGSSDITLQSGDQIQPDNAISHTTFTLSYVSRSHVFSTHDSLSRHSPLFSMPPVSRFSLHPPCDSDKGLEETGCALSQHYLEQIEEPVNLTTQTELLQPLSLAQMQPENCGEVCLMQEPHAVNGGVISINEDMDTHIQGKEEQEHSLCTVNSSDVENGQGDSWSSSGGCAKTSPETLTPITGEDEERQGSEVVFLQSRKQDPVFPDSVGARDLCSLRREYISPLEDPVSPSATSLDDVEDVFILPQASSSPSGENSFLETTEDVVWSTLSTEGGIQPGSGISNSAMRLESSSESKQPVHRRKAAIEPLIDLADDCVLNKPKAVVPHMNGNAKALQRTLREKKLPMRSGRGTRLEAIVMDINSSRYKVSGCIHTSNNASASQSETSDCSLPSPKKTGTLSVVKRKVREKALPSVKQRAVTQIKRLQTGTINSNRCKDSTSDCEVLNNSTMSHSSTPSKSAQFAMHKKSKKEDVLHPIHLPQTSPSKSKKTSSQSSPQFAAHKNSKKEPELVSHPDSSVEIHVARFSPPPSKSPKKCQGKTKGKAIKTSPTAKTKATHTPKRRQKKHKHSPSSSMFSPKEPEIKLKYVNYKEEKKDLRLDSFSPFIRVERHQSFPSRCTIINYSEEVRTQHKKGQQPQAHPSGFISAIVPNTSCFQLGRASMHSQHQRSLVCSFCGQAANAMDLGDLHGPYYPEGYQPSTKTPASMSGLKEDEDDYSDSDSSSFSIRGRRRKCAMPPTQWPLRAGAHLKKKGLLESHRWADGSGSPATKRARLNTSCADVEDWYSAPVLPMEPCEYWLHEDCGIWSTGVFLVKGKVYGLEEAVRVAQETMCSACRDPGATLGCFFKSCPNKYHYRCALKSDCVLIEENFSMKCKKHKNKTFKAPPGNRRADR
ncbi:transcription factor 20 isoform X2 [Mastacembelus armatus]|uniref:transcription factor 20 isoform X2 n=1 Tax=Mastacembelus armatus TaxID=205130 RepID=UPI000E460374|nr:transcription factor 20-like isoform X2 [Mastacembelus armatus]